MGPAFLCRNFFSQQASQLQDSIFNDFQQRILLFPEGQFLMVTHSNHRSAIKANFDVGLQLFLSLFSSHYNLYSLWLERSNHCFS